MPINRALSRLRSDGSTSETAKAGAEALPAAILFGSIGTLVETSDLQREAFNQAFAEAGLDWTWDVATYRRLLEKPGGMARIERYAAEHGQEVDAETLHRRKTALFDQEIEEGSIDLRPGVEEVIDFARGKGIPLGFVTTTSRANIDAMFSATTGQLTQEMFDFVGDVTMAAKPKPAPDIFLAALQKMDLAADRVIAIEDTVPCFSAARAAGIATIAFPNEFAAHDGYDDALAVVDQLAPALFGQN